MCCFNIGQVLCQTVVPQNLALKYHFVFAVVLNIKCFSDCFLFLFCFVVCLVGFFLSEMLFFALICSQRMRETTIYFISCVHLLRNLNLNILNWVGVKKITCSSILQCGILKVGFSSARMLSAL